MSDYMLPIQTVAAGFVLFGLARLAAAARDFRTSVYSMRDRARRLLVACSVLGIDADCNKAAWWNDAGVDPVKVARKLWKHTSVNEGVIQPGRPEYGAAAERTLESDIHALEGGPAPIT